MINDAGPGSEIFEAEMQRWAVELGLASVSDATPEELLLQLYDGMGGQFLTQLSAMSETDRQTVCQKLDVILQGGHSGAAEPLSGCGADHGVVFSLL